MKTRVIVGEPFKGTSARMCEDKEAAQGAVQAAHESKTRNAIAKAVCLTGGSALIGATILGAYDGSFDEVSNVWVAFGPILGAVVGYYFGGKPNRT